jgi:hypothetical protein
MAWPRHPWAGSCFIVQPVGPGIFVAHKEANASK